MTHFFRPSARIDIAGQSLSAAEAGLQTAQVTLGRDHHSTAQLGLWLGSKFAGAAPGDPITIALGPEGDEELVLTGQVTGTGPTADAMVLEAEDASGQLSRQRVTRTFEDMSLADIAAALGQEAGLTVEADSGDLLGVYYAEPSRTLWDHLRYVAHLGGNRLVPTADGGLALQSAGQGRHDLRYGAELLDWQLTKGTAPAPLVSGQHGGAGGLWHWIEADPLGDAPDPARIRGVLGDRGTADTASQGAATRAAEAAVTGTLVISGAPEIRPGDSVTLSDMPVGDPGGLTVDRVRHSLDGQLGFLTSLHVGAGDGDGGLLGALGGLL